MKKKILLLAMIVSLFILSIFLIKTGKENVKETLVSDEADSRKSYENVLCSAVRIQGKGHYGSGSIYCVTEEEMIIVTGGHVLPYFDEESYVTFFDGKKAYGTVLGVSRKADVGFLAVPLSAFTSEELENYRCVRKEQSVYENLKKNDCFFMIDLANNTDAPVFYEGCVVEKEKWLEEYEAEMLYGDGYAVPGMSGCGVFDERGYYIALLSGCTEQCEIAAVPLKTIEEAYEEIKNQFT